MVDGPAGVGLMMPPPVICCRLTAPGPATLMVVDGRAATAAGDAVTGGFAIG